MEVEANAVCPKCTGSGSVETEHNGIRTCAMCGGHGIIEVLPITDRMQGCWHSAGSTGSGSPVNGYPRSFGVSDDVIGTPRTNAPSKTLLDKFAIAAMTSVSIDLGNHMMSPVSDQAMSVACYNLAAAMMAERARRDEMGNVKEVES